MPKLKIHVSTDTRRTLVVRRSKCSQRVGLKYEMTKCCPIMVIPLLIVLGHARIVKMPKGESLFLRRN